MCVIVFINRAPRVRSVWSYGDWCIVGFVLRQQNLRRMGTEKRCSKSATEKHGSTGSGLVPLQNKRVSFLYQIILGKKINVEER